MSRPNQLSQQEYATILDSIDHAIIVIDQEEKITLFNSTAQLYTGLAEKRIIGQPFFDCFCKQKKLCTLVRSAIDSGRSISTHETVTLKISNSPSRQVSVSAAPIFSATTNQPGAVILLHDLTRICSLEKAGRHADRLTMVETMAAGLAHEIKNPLGGIKGSAQLLHLELEGNAELQEYTELIVRETDRLNRIIEELLNLSRPRKTEIEPVNIGLLLDEIVKLQNRSAHNREIRFKLQFDPSIPNIPGDHDLLMRLFLNLIKNSCEATPDHSTITIVTRIDSDYYLNLPGSRPTPVVQISISDQGSGISATELEKAFTPFYTTKSTGNGLGLPICQKIVTDHAGQLQFTDLPEGGTRVSVSLPLFNSRSSSDAITKGK